MNTQPAQSATTRAQAVVHNFLEDSCHDKNDQLKRFLNPVVFRLFSVGGALGPRVDVAFTANYGIYYDPDDNPLIQCLLVAEPGIDWGRMTYHRRHDRPRVEVINTETGKVVARIETRRYFGRQITEKAVQDGRYGENVVCLVRKNEPSESEE